MIPEQTNPVLLIKLLSTFCFVHSCKEMRQKKESKKDGVLIFDEVKVINRLMWNSRSQKLIGLCMSHQEQSSLADIFQVSSQVGGCT